MWIQNELSKRFTGFGESFSPVLPAEDRAVGLVNEGHVLVGQDEAMSSIQVAQVGRGGVVHFHVKTDRCEHTHTHDTTLSTTLRRCLT